MSKLSLRSVLLSVLLIAAGCGGSGDAPYDSNTDVPPGDPAFTPLGQTWVIDNAGTLGSETVQRSDRICQQLQDNGIAEIVVLVQNGVKHPADYATHYGRWLKLGKKGLSSEGGNNGVVWLIRPDADLKITYSIGRGLPQLTSGHMVDIINAAKEYINFGNFDAGVLILVQETDKTLRTLYGRKGETR